MCGDWRVGSELEVSYFVDVCVKFEWWFIVCMVYYSSVKRRLNVFMSLGVRDRGRLRELVVDHDALPTVHECCNSIGIVL